MGLLCCNAHSVCVLSPQLPLFSHRSQVTNPRIWAPTWPFPATCRATLSPGSPGGGWMGLPSSPGPSHPAPAASSGQALWPSRVGRLNLKRTQFHEELRHLRVTTWLYWISYVKRLDFCDRLCLWYWCHCCWLAAHFTVSLWIQLFGHWLQSSSCKLIYLCWNTRGL